VTYRQLLHWTALGYIKPSERERTGTGNPIQWSTEDAVQVCVMRQLTAIGFAPARAAEHRADPETVEIGIDSENVSVRIDIEAIRAYTALQQHELFHVDGLRAVGCDSCKAETDAIWQARADRGWVTDPSDPGWREQDAESMIRKTNN
jgi:hypothetical protein